MSQTPAAFPSSTASSASSSSVPMVVITVVGILAAFALLASYYAFVTRCQLLRALLAPWRGGGGVREDSASSSAAVAAEASDERRRRGLGLPLIRMLPVVKFTAADGRRVSVSSECAVCLSEFAEKERVRLLPGCSHAFHIDCIDTWLQGSARCPFCRRSVTLPPMPLVPLPPKHGHGHGDYDERRRRRDERLVTSGGDGGDGAIVIEVRGERESWGVGGRKVQRKKAVGDEAVETRRRKDGGGEFAVEPMRRSLSMDSSSACCDKLYVSVDRPAAGAELAS